MIKNKSCYNRPDSGNLTNDYHYLKGATSILPHMTHFPFFRSQVGQQTIITLPKKNLLNPIDSSTKLWNIVQFFADLHNNFLILPSKLATAFCSGFEILFFDFVILMISLRLYGQNKHILIDNHMTWFIIYLTFSEAGEKGLPPFPKILTSSGIGKGNLNFLKTEEKYLIFRLSNADSLRQQRWINGYISPLRWTFSDLMQIQSSPKILLRERNTR